MTASPHLSHLFAHAAVARSAHPRLIKSAVSGHHRLNLGGNSVIPPPHSHATHVTRQRRRRAAVAGFCQCTPPDGCLVRGQAHMAARAVGVRNGQLLHRVAQRTAGQAFVPCWVRMLGPNGHCKRQIGVRGSVPGSGADTHGIAHLTQRCQDWQHAMWQQRGGTQQAAVPIAHWPIFITTSCKQGMPC